jgi:hypothetical protein
VTVAGIEATGDLSGNLPPDKVSAPSPAYLTSQPAAGISLPLATAVNPDFPDGFVVSAWRLRLLLGKPSDSNNFLLKRPRTQWVRAKMTPSASISTANSSWNFTA